MATQPVPSSARLDFMLIAATVGVAALMAIYGPWPMPLMEPDSLGYLNFGSSRTSLYPTFLNLLASIGMDIGFIPYIQLTIYCITLAWLMVELRKFGSAFWVRLLFGLAVSCNFYYQSYHFTILTESLTFSLHNSMLASMMLWVRLRHGTGAWLALAGMAIIVGVMAGLRPALWSAVPGLAVVIALRTWGDLRSLVLSFVVGAVSIGAPLALESALYYQQHDSRHSLLPLTLFGKAAILTTDPDVDISVEPARAQDLVDMVDASFDPVEEWLASLPNPFIRVTRLADFEVYGQYSQLFGDEVNEVATDIGLPPHDLMEKIGWAAITQNPWAYAKISLQHYLGLWSVNVLTAFGPESDPPGRPFSQQMDEQAYTKEGRIVAMFSFLAFLSLGAVVFVLSLIAAFWLVVIFMRWRPAEIPPITFTVVNLLVFVQANLLLTAFVNVSTPRYLMVTYPFAVLAVLLALQSLLDMKYLSRKYSAEVAYHH